MNHHSFLKQPFLLQFCISMADKSCADKRDFLKEVVSQYFEKKSQAVGICVALRGQCNTSESFLFIMRYSFHHIIKLSSIC